MSALHPLHVRRLAVVFVAGLSIAACGVSTETISTEGPATTAAEQPSTTEEKPKPSLPSPTVPRTTTTARRTTTTKAEPTTTKPAPTTTKPGGGGGDGSTFAKEKMCDGLDPAAISKILGSDFEPMDSPGTSEDDAYCSFASDDFVSVSFFSLGAYGNTDPMMYADVLDKDPEKITLPNGLPAAISDTDYTMSGYTIAADSTISVMVLDGSKQSTTPEMVTDLLQLAVDAGS